MVKELKDLAAANPYALSSKLVGQVMDNHGAEVRQYQDSNIVETNLRRVANRYRQSKRPPPPRNLEFELDEQYIPKDFLVRDVRVGERRHFVFAKPDHLTILCEAEDLYVDGTFKVI